MSYIGILGGKPIISQMLQNQGSHRYHTDYSLRTALVVWEDLENPDYIVWWESAANRQFSFRLLGVSISLEER